MTAIVNEVTSPVGMAGIQPQYGFQGYPAPVRPASPRFGQEKPVEAAPEPQKEPQKPAKTPLERLWHGILRVAPAANFIGGLMLLTSVFLPEQTQPAAPENPPAATASATPQMTAAERENAENALADIRDLLIKLGWILGSAGLLAGKVNVMAAGKTSRQPSMVLGGLWGMGAATWMMFDPTVAVRTAFLTASALLISGYANKVRNEFQLKEGDVPREFDMRPLYSKKVLRELVGNDDPKSQQLVREWVKQLKNMSLFVAGDQALIVKDVTKSVVAAVTHPKQSFKPKEWIKPSALQNRLGSMLIYAGGVPMLILNGDTRAVEQAGQALIAAGSMTADLSLIAVGNAKKDMAGKAMMVGVLAMNGGILGFQTTPGAGVAMMGNATVDYYFAKEAEKEESEKPEKKD